MKTTIAPYSENTSRLRHPYSRIVFRSGGTRVFVHKDAARAAARSSRADDCRPRGTDTLDRHDRVHNSKVSLVDGDFSAIQGDRVFFLDYGQIERRFVTASANLTTTASARVLEDGEFFVIFFNSDRGKVA